tara:strand:- start:1067 stop:1783 length:717 start_codon:yes stop_codon:yes gene_type:complete
MLSVKNIYKTALLVITCLLFSGCSDKASEPMPVINVSAGVNIFNNSGFEKGRDPWISLTTSPWGKAFSLSDEFAHQGIYSAKLSLNVLPQTEGKHIFGVVQEVRPSEFPDIISGYYYVKDWQRKAQEQYLQLVIIAIGSDNMPFPSRQIRYLLSGTDKEPIIIANARFVIVDKKDPPLSKWVYFEVKPADDFKNLWGKVPTNFKKLRILFEVRTDGDIFAESKASVYYDDLYLGISQK